VRYVLVQQLATAKNTFFAPKLIPGSQHSLHLFLIDKKDFDKKVHCANGSRLKICSLRLCQSLYDGKEKRQLELCALLAIAFRIVN
jgi:hypothetical protein